MRGDTQGGAGEAGKGHFTQGLMGHKDPGFYAGWDELLEGLKERSDSI